ncbi:MAG: hypothetical protein ACLRWQ_08725 [Flavonifractor plautii]
MNDTGRGAVPEALAGAERGDTLTHPYLQEKLPWGLVPYVQALLLARCLRRRFGRLSALSVEVRVRYAGADYL